jgi:hypothetical protein
MLLHRYQIECHQQGDRVVPNMARLTVRACRQAGSWCSSPHSIACRCAENRILVAIALRGEPRERLIEPNGAAVRDA